MRIFLTGGTGFVGRRLTREFLALGHETTVLTRALREGQGQEPGPRRVVGDPTRPGPWQQEVPFHDVIVNLAGASIFSRWGRQTKERIYDSRILTTRNLVEALRACPDRRTSLFLGTSAVGYYGFCGEEERTETSPPGKGFLAEVVRAWEAEAAKAGDLGLRVVLCRFGIVLGRDGGALGLMSRPFRYGIGSPLGSGRQWFSWIHEEDLLQILLFLLARKDLSGPVNCTAPGPVTNRALSRALCKALGRPCLLPAIPGFLLRMVLGEFGTVLLEGQKVLPRRLLGSGFRFRFPAIEGALEDLLAPRPHA